MKFRDLRVQVAETSHLVYRMGFTQGTGGNISIRIPEAPELILITPKGGSLRDILPESLLLMDPERRVIEGSGMPSKELGFHSGIYSIRPQVGAVIHCHPTYSIIMSMSSDELFLPSVTARKVLERVPVASLAPSGSVELAGYVVEAFATKSSQVILMREHGLCAVGTTLEEAFNVVDLTEATAKQAYLLALSERRAEAEREHAR